MKDLRGKNRDPYNAGSSVTNSYEEARAKESQVTAAVEAYKGELRRKIEERKAYAEKWPLLDSHRELVVNEFDWFLSLIGGEGETLKK